MKIVEFAPVSESVDDADLGTRATGAHISSILIVQQKSAGLERLCPFKSGRGHQSTSNRRNAVRKDLEGIAENITVRPRSNCAFDIQTCDNYAEMRCWHKVILSFPYPDIGNTRHAVLDYLNSDEDPQGVIYGDRWVWDVLDSNTGTISLGGSSSSVIVPGRSVEDYEFYVRDRDVVTTLALMWPDCKIWRGESRNLVDEQVFITFFS